MQVDEATERRRLRKRKEKIPKNLKREANEKEMDGFTKRVLRILVEKPFDEVYFTHRLWMFFRETKETEEDIRSVGTEIRTINFRLNKETRKTLISQRTRISANYHTSSNQNMRITTIRIRNRKREQSRSYSESVYERLQQGISLGSRAVGEIPSSSNPKTAKPN